MKRQLNFIALAFVLLFSCQKVKIEKENPEILELQTASSGSQSSRYTYLSVEIVDATGNKIASDAAELSTTPRYYIHGEQNVRAEFQHANGDFFMMTNKLTTKPAKRFFKFPGNLDLENKNDYRIRIKDDLDIISIQSMPIGVPDEMVMRLWSFDSKGVMLFDITFDPARTAETSKVIVTRTETNTWEAVPVDPAMAVITRANVPNAPEAVPFKFILRKKG